MCSSYNGCGRSVFGFGLKSLFQEKGRENDEKKTKKTAETIEETRSPLNR